VVYRIARDGGVTTLLQATERHVMGLAAAPDGTLYVGVGPSGKLYRIRPDKTVATLFDPQTSHVVALSLLPASETGGGLLLTTAGPSRVYRLPLSGAGEGVFLSPVHDAGGPARWGALRWSAAKGGTIRLQTRSGNTAYPDTTWSDWSAAYERAEGQPVASPAGQFIQYRALLKAADGAPSALQSVELYYMTRNRAPEISLSAPTGRAVWSGRKNAQWSARDPDRDRLTFDLFYAPEGSQAWKKVKAEDSSLEGFLKEQVARRAVAADAAPPAAPGGDAAEAEAAAAEGAADEAAATGEEESALATEQAWNTREVADGRYRLKVVASDALANPGEPLTAEALSEVLTVDNTAPLIDIRKAARRGEAPPAEIPCRDALCPIAGAEYRVDNGEWIGAAAADGIFDSPAEAIRLDPSRLPAGRHTLSLRVRDAAGNERGARIAYRK
jgi:hypothetical protein